MLVVAILVIIRVRVDAGDRERRAAEAAERDRQVAEQTTADSALQTKVDADTTAMAGARADAFARFDAKDLPGGEARWSDAQRLAMVRRARERVLSEHTYLQRVRNWIAWYERLP